MSAYEQIVHWLSLGGQNMMFGIVAVFVYSTFRNVFERKSRNVQSTVIGILCGLSCIASIGLSFAVPPNIQADLRHVFILLGGLFGGVIGTSIAIAASIAARFYFVGPPLPAGVVAMFASGLVGVAFARAYAKQSAEYSIGVLFTAGLISGVTTVVLVGLLTIPFEVQIAYVLTCCVTTMILGTSLLLTHPRIWRLTQRHLTQLIDTTTDLVWETAADGALTYASPRYGEILGYDQSEMLGKSFRDLGIRWVDPLINETFESIRSKAKPFDQLHCIAPAKDGTLKYLSVTGRPTFDMRGKFMGFRGIATDITERQHLEAQGRQYYERLEIAQKVGKIGSIEIDTAANTSEWSNGMFSLLGVERGAVTPGMETFLSFVHPDDRDMLIRLRAQSTAGQNNPPSEFRIVRPDGEVRRLLRQSQAVPGVNGGKGKVVVTLVDVTETRRMEEELRISHENLVHAQRLGSIGSARVDLRTGKAVWSEEQCRMYGLAPESVPQTFEAYLEFVHPDDRAMLLEVRGRDGRGEPTAPIEYRIVRSDGENRWVHREAETQYDDSGTPIALITTQQDITVRHRLEEEERRRQEQEAQAGKVEALGNLAGGIAHDFNNLLGAILGYGNFLVEDLAGDSEQHRFARRILDVAQRGRSLVKQILTFSRRADVELTKLALKGAIDETLDLLRATLPTTTQLVSENRAEDAVILADGGQIVQVLVNLCVNGSDALAGAPGTVKIAVGRLDKSRAELAGLPIAKGKPSPAAVETWRGEDGASYVATGAIPLGDCIALTVTDTGSGIPDVVLGRMFEPFRTTKAVGRGTGLGLAVVHRIVREHGGAIILKTVKGRGTSFEVLLEAAESGGAPSRREQNETTTKAPTVSSGSILIVDDDDDYRIMIETAMARRGYRVKTTNDPRVALEYARQGEPRWDVLVTDQTMPHLRGSDLIREFKKLSASTRCILCSGFADGLDEQKALAIGASAFMLKPFDTDHLARLIEQMPELRGKLLS